MSFIKINKFRLDNAVVETVSNDPKIIKVKVTSDLKTIHEIIKIESGLELNIDIDGTIESFSLGRRLFDKSGYFIFYLTDLTLFKESESNPFVEPLTLASTLLRNSMDIYQQQNQVIHEILRLSNIDFSDSNIINKYIQEYPEDYLFQYEVVDLKKLEKIYPSLA
ncbi:hypothetical protein [Leuconostoc citreum]